MVSNEAVTKAPSSITYFSVVSRENFHLDFLIAELNDLDVMGCDVGNACLDAPCQEKIWFTSGTENNPEKKGKVMVMVIALYGLKSS